jgi:hypothetical protein
LQAQAKIALITGRILSFVSATQQNKDPEEAYEALKAGISVVATQLGNEAGANLVLCENNSAMFWW